MVFTCQLQNFNIHWQSEHSCRLLVAVATMAKTVPDCPARLGSHILIRERESSEWRGLRLVAQSKQKFVCLHSWTFAGRIFTFLMKNRHGKIKHDFHILLSPFFRPVEAWETVPLCGTTAWASVSFFRKVAISEEQRVRIRAGQGGFGLKIILRFLLYSQRFNVLECILTINLTKFLKWNVNLI